jgi:hypothetical protein
MERTIPFYRETAAEAERPGQHGVIDLVNGKPKPRSGACVRRARAVPRAQGQVREAEPAEAGVLALASFDAYGTHTVSGPRLAGEHHLGDARPTWGTLSTSRPRFSNLHSTGQGQMMRTHASGTLGRRTALDGPVGEMRAPNA